MRGGEGGGERKRRERMLEGERKNDGGKTRELKPYIYKVGKRKKVAGGVREKGKKEEREQDKK